MPRTGPLAARLKARLKDELATLSKLAGYSLGNAIYSHRYHRLCRALGDLPHHLVDQEALAKAAHPFYHSLARGGEGHLEVGKNILYSVNRDAHMVSEPEALRLHAVHTVRRRAIDGRPPG